jgi:hypothetical protein
MNRRVATLLAIPTALLALACGAGQQGTSTSAGDAGNTGAEAAKPAEVATVAAGQPLNYKRTILTTTTAATITVSNPRVVKSDNQFIKPDKGQHYAVDVSIQVTEGKMMLTQGSFKLVAADGTVFDTTGIPVAKPDLGYSELAAGQKTSGAVTFDMAKGAEKGAKIALKDLLAEGDAGYWTI